MIDVQPFAELGRFENDWLKARFHFSFAEYMNPDRMGLGPLRVWNDDTIVPGGGFPMHGHRDMEIITYVRQGAITHEDHLGNKGRTEAGDIQVMHAGTGIMHSEYNHEAEETRIYQIWIMPDKTGVEPGWAARAFPKDARSGKLETLASGRPGATGDVLPIHQDAAVLAATVEAGGAIVHDLAPNRRAYLALARGTASLNGKPLGERDGAAIEDESRVELMAEDECEVILVDLP